MRPLHKTRRRRRQIPIEHGRTLVLDHNVVVGSIDNWGGNFVAFEHVTDVYRIGRAVGLFSTLDQAVAAIPNASPDTVYAVPGEYVS